METIVMIGLQNLLILFFHIVGVGLANGLALFSYLGFGFGSLMIMKKKPKKQKTEMRTCENENCGKVTSKGYETGPWNAKVFLCDTCFEDDIRLSTTPRKPKVISHKYKRMQK